MFGGAVSTNDSSFEKFALSEIKNLRNFQPQIFKTDLDILCLKNFSIKLFYRLFFFKIIKLAHKKT